MENSRFSQSNMYYNKNNLSPFGQKILNTFCKDHQLNNEYDQSYRQKTKLKTLTSSRTSRPSSMFRPKEQLDEHLNYTYRLNDRDITHDNDVGHVPTLGLHFDDKHNNHNSGVGLSSQLHSVNKNIQQNNNFIFSAGLLQLNVTQNDAIEDSSTLENTHNKENPEVDPVHLLSYNAKEDNTNFTTAELFQLNPIQNSSIAQSIDLSRPLEFYTNSNFDKQEAESYNKDINVLSFELPISTDINDVNNEADCNGNDVPWSEMLDTELLPDTSVPVIKDKLPATHNTQPPTGNDNKFKILFPNEMATKPKVACKSKANKNKNKEVIKPKQIKRKIETTLDVDILKTNFKAKQKNVRKEKYTKTVKRWLNGNQNNPVIEVQKNLTITSNNIVESNTPSGKHMAAIKKQDVPVKKKVQAKLTNKGGIMKFSNPEAAHDGSVTSLGQTEGSGRKMKKKVKVQSKRKPKFTAPFKSQEPVKDIAYNVIAVDENNWKEYTHLPKQNSNIAELYVVLVYRNGSCQLDTNIAKEDCITDGIMLFVDEEFYYFKNPEGSMSNILLKIVEGRTVICHDGKKMLIYFKNNDLDINFAVHDVKIGGALLEPDNPPDSFDDLQKLTSSSPQYAAATECQLQRTAWYLTLLRDCAGKLKAKLLEHSLWALFEDIEMKVLPIIADMEHRGIQVNTEKLLCMENRLVSRMRAAEQACQRAAGRRVALLAPAQVAALLYGELRLPAPPNNSTSEPMLRTLVGLHPLPGLILEYRRLHKAHATFVAGIRQHVKDGVLKPVWVQTAAATGRVASHSPNVQAIPRTPFCLSADADNPEEVLELRSVYEARGGHVLLAADFRQMECRVFAAAAADGALRAALRTQGDLFTDLAAQWLQKPAAMVSAADRERAKRLVYARLYGAGVRRLADILGLGYRRALSVSASFDRTFPSLKEFGLGVARACAAGRAPRSAAGRARPLPALAAAAPAARARALRQAVNFLVQGTAADVCKIAMCEAQARLRAAGVRAQLLLQIHDELVWEVPAHQLDQAHAAVRLGMEGAGALAGLAAPLAVAARAGPTWAALAPLHYPREEDAH